LTACRYEIAPVGIQRCWCKQMRMRVDDHSVSLREINESRTGAVAVLEYISPTPLSA
jgi:hypothetical protein